MRDRASDRVHLGDKVRVGNDILRVKQKLAPGTYELERKDGTTLAVEDRAIDEVIVSTFGQPSREGLAESAVAAPSEAAASEGGETPVPTETPAPTEPEAPQA